MEKAYCVQCATNRKVSEIMGGEHLVFSTCGHVVPIPVAKGRDAFIAALKEMDILDILDRLQATAMASSYSDPHGQDQIFILRAEIISRLQVRK